MCKMKCYAKEDITKLNNFRGGFPNIYVLENPPKMKNMCNENI